MKTSSSAPILYRVVELCRGRHGRLEKLGSAWYADVNRVRAIGNWMARNMTIRDEVVFDDVFARGREMLLCSEIPLKLFLDGEEVHVPLEIPDVSDADILGSRSRLMNDIECRSSIGAALWATPSSRLPLPTGSLTARRLSLLIRLPRS